MKKNRTNFWLKEINEIKKIKNINIPINIFLNESACLSGYVQKYWEPAPNHPGLKEAAPVVYEEIAEEIMALCREINTAHTTAIQESESRNHSKGASVSAQNWIQEILHFLKWAENRCSVDEYPPLQMDVPTLSRSYYKGRKNASSLAAWIAHYLEVSVNDEPTLVQIPGYTPEIRQKGKALVQTLQTVRRGRPLGSKHRREALLYKRQLTHLLAERIRRIRSAARFVFRNHPEIRRQAMSEFERRRRQKNRTAAREVTSIER